MKLIITRDNTAVGKHFDELAKCADARVDGDRLYITRESECYREVEQRTAKKRPAKKRRTRVPAAGPGTELEKLFKLLGVTPKSGCACETLRNAMNVLGVDGCRARKDIIVAELKRKGEAYGWGVKLTAALNAARHGILVNPLDPIPGLVEMAIREADKAQARTPSAVPEATDTSASAAQSPDR